MNVKEKENKWWMNWRLLRNVLLFVAGLTGLVTLTVVWVITDRQPDSSLIVVFSAMLGLPLVLVRDEGEK